MKYRKLGIYVLILVIVGTFVALINEYGSTRRSDYYYASDVPFRIKLAEGWHTDPTVDGPVIIPIEGFSNGMSQLSISKPGYTGYYSGCTSAKEYKDELDALTGWGATVTEMKISGIKATRITRIDDPANPPLRALYGSADYGTTPAREDYIVFKYHCRMWSVHFITPQSEAAVTMPQLESMLTSFRIRRGFLFFHFY